MHNKYKNVNRIDVGKYMRKQLINEFQTNKMTIYNALVWKSYSYNAYKIRKRAADLLMQESERVKENN